MRNAHGTERRKPGGLVHAIVVRDGAWFVAQCVEIAVVTQGRSLDETADSLREAIALHLDHENLATLGLSTSPRLLMQYETSIEPGGAPA